MNKRSHPGGLGLPAKPYTPQIPGPAPPLPAGPLPAQPSYSHDQQAAHAAAWAAYYQSQGANAGAAYTAAAAAQPVASPAPSSNPYANYGYGAGAPHVAQAQTQPPHNQGYQSQPSTGAAYTAGPSGYRPPAPQAPPAPAPAQPAQGGYGNQMQYGQGYTPPPAPVYTPTPVTRPPYGQQQYGWGQQQQQQQQHQQQLAQPQQQLPPAPGYQQAQPGYTPQQHQSYYPQQAPQGAYGNTSSPSPSHQSYRPSPVPPQQNRPYQPQPGPSPRVPSIPVRPPVSAPGPGGPGGFPPAKRPRFDAPGGNGPIPPRPPTGPAVRPPPGNFGTGLARPMGGAGRGGAAGPGPGPAPAIPRIGFNGPTRGGSPMRGGMGRGGATLGGGMGRGGNLLAPPRGPGAMRRADMNRPTGPRVRAVEPTPREREREREKKRKDKIEKEAKTTMTDFRIVGIEVKELGWSWGLVGEHSLEVKVEDDIDDNKPTDEEKAVSDTKEVTNADVDSKEDTDDGTDAVDEKRGEKRKAKPSSLDGDADQSSPKKRTSTFHMTHGKSNVALAAASVPSPESNQNRFRIYFESPPELDRVPKAARRNPNKRWRRESSSVAPSRLDDAHEADHDAENDTEEHEHADTANVSRLTESDNVIENGHDKPAEEAEIQGDILPDTSVLLPSDALQDSKAENLELATNVAALVDPVESTVVSAPEIDAVKTSAISVVVTEPATEEATESEPTSKANEPPSAVITEAAPTTDSTESGADVSKTTADAVTDASADETEEYLGDVSMVTNVSLTDFADEVGTEEEKKEVPGLAASEVVEPATDAAEASVSNGLNTEVSNAGVVAADAEVADNGSAEDATAIAVTITDDNEAPIAEPADNVSTDAAVDASGLTGAEASAAAVAAAMAESAQNAASAYGSRNSKARSRRWSTSSLESQADSMITTHTSDVSQPSVNRVSVLYEDSSRRLVFDSSVVHKIRIFRTEGKIEVDLLPETIKPVKTDENGEEKPSEEAEAPTELPKGVLIETFDVAEQRFVALSSERLEQLQPGDRDGDISIPPLHRAFAAVPPSDPITLTVYLNKKKPLSEPKWCRTNQADEWLHEQFGATRRGADAGWRNKLEIMDPDAPPTLQSILDAWKNVSSSGTVAERLDFTTSLLASPNDLLEILLRLTRGDRNPTASIGMGPSSANGPLATAIRSDSPYASHQTHVSLAILAMYRLTTDFAHQAGVKTEVLNEKIADIIKSLPTHMIHKSLDGLYKEWLAEKRA